jgi:hypothetical protein
MAALTWRSKPYATKKMIARFDIAAAVNAGQPRETRWLPPFKT